MKWNRFKGEPECKYSNWCEAVYEQITEADFDEMDVTGFTDSYNENKIMEALFNTSTSIEAAAEILTIFFYDQKRLRHAGNKPNH